MAITATVNTRRSVVGSVSQGSQPQVTRVTVPGPKGDTGGQASASNIQLSALSDVDVTSFPVQDGSLLQYRSSTGNDVTSTFPRSSKLILAAAATLPASPLGPGTVTRVTCGWFPCDTEPTTLLLVFTVAVIAIVLP